MQNIQDPGQKLNEAQGQLLVKLARYTLMKRLGQQIPQTKFDSLNTAYNRSLKQNLIL
jgi:hypothetical protein